MKLPFPLPLTPFEFYFLCEHRPNFPSIIPIRIEASGQLDRPSLDRAYQLVHERHPLLSATIEQPPGDWPQWVPAEPVPIQYIDDADRNENPGSIAPAGLVLVVREQRNRVDFEFIFSHLAVDGLGAFQVISDLFVAYAHLSADTVASLKLRRLEPAILSDRDYHCLSRRRMKLIDLLRIAKVHLPLSFRQAALVNCEKQVQSCDQAASDSASSCFQTRLLSVQDTSELSRVAAMKSVTLNDLLLRDFFLTLAEWNRGTAESRWPLRILIPTDMRRRSSLRMPAANLFSYVFLTRREADCQNRDRLLTSIREETVTMKRQKRGLYYEAGLRLICRWPRFARWSLNRDHAFATAVFTNLGASFDRIPLPERNGRKVAQDLEFDNGAGIGPIRPKTRASFAISSYAGQLAISANCDSLSLTGSQQRALLDAYIGNLRATIADQS